MSVYIMRLKKKALPPPPHPFYLKNVRNTKWHSNLANIQIFLGWGNPLLVLQMFLFSPGSSHHNITSSFPPPISPSLPRVYFDFPHDLRFFTKKHRVTASVMAIKVAKHGKMLVIFKKLATKCV